jgi:tRNA(adenine34) deaminase
MAAIMQFRVKRLVYGAKDHRLGAHGSWVDLTDSQHPFHTVSITTGVLEKESSAMLKSFFQHRRNATDLLPHLFEEQ